MSELLKITHFSCGYGGRSVLDGVSLDVREETLVHCDRKAVIVRNQTPEPRINSSC